MTKGELSRPHSPAELEKKFMQLGVPLWGDDIARQVLEGCMRIETLGDFSTHSSTLTL